PAHAPDRDRALSGAAQHELGSRLRGFAPRHHPRPHRVHRVPALLRRWPGLRSDQELMTSTLTTTDLVASSVRMILDGQAPSGAYVASPSFSQYGFGWLRDGSYVALAMDAAGRSDSARAFHTWVARTITGQRARIADIVARLDRGEHVP